MRIQGSILFSGERGNLLRKFAIKSRGGRRDRVRPRLNFEGHWKQLLFCSMYSRKVSAGRPSSSSIVVVAGTPA